MFIYCWFENILRAKSTNSLELFQKLRQKDQAYWATKLLKPRFAPPAEIMENYMAEYGELNLI